MNSGSKVRFTCFVPALFFKFSDGLSALDSTVVFLGLRFRGIAAADSPHGSLQDGLTLRHRPN